LLILNALVVEHVRSEEFISQHERANVLLVGVDTRVDTSNHTVTETANTSGELVRSARIDTRVVDVGLFGALERQEAHYTRHVLAQQNRHVLVVRDVLHLGYDDAACLFEYGSVVPCRVERTQDIGYAVVLANKHRLEHLEARVLVHSVVASQKASLIIIR
jgi:hypothetical protein